MADDICPVRGISVPDLLRDELGERRRLLALGREGRRPALLLCISVNHVNFIFQKFRGFTLCFVFDHLLPGSKSLRTANQAARVVSGNYY